MNHGQSNQAHQVVGDGEEDGAEDGDDAAQGEAGDESLDPGGPAQGRCVKSLGDDAPLFLVVGAVGFVVASESSLQLIHDLQSKFWRIVDRVTEAGSDGVNA